MLERYRRPADRSIAGQALSKLLLRGLLRRHDRLVAWPLNRHLAGLFTAPRRPPARPPRRVVIGAAVFALFVVFDIGLFSYLILSSLSQRELEKVLLETRQVAEPIAQNLEAAAAQSGGKDLYVVMSTATEAKTYIDRVIAKRELVKSVEVRDKNGQVLYQTSNRQDLPTRGAELLQFRPIDQVEVPIGGELGTVVIGLSEEAVQERIAVLRRDLTRQATLLGVITVLLLLAAFAAFVLVYKRSRRLEEQALEAERLAYIGTLASGLAHEIRSPLNSLSLNMQMLEEEVQSKANPALAGQQRLLTLTRSELKRLEQAGQRLPELRQAAGPRQAAGQGGGSPAAGARRAGRRFARPRHRGRAGRRHRRRGARRRSRPAGPAAAEPRLQRHGGDRVGRPRQGRGCCGCWPGARATTSCWR